MEMLLKLIGDYRSWPLLAALIYLLVKGQIKFRYPRSKKK